MIEHILNTGSSGQLRIQDNTDDPNQMTVSMAIRTTVFNMPNMGVSWAYSIDADRQSWRSFTLARHSNWQNLGIAFVDSSKKAFTLHLGATNTPELGGPTDFTVDLYNHLSAGIGQNPLVDIQVGNAIFKAEVWVRSGGMWGIAQPHIRTPTGWKTT